MTAATPEMIEKGMIEAATADTRLARRAGAHALATSVASESAAAAASTSGSTRTGTPSIPLTKEANAS